MSMRAWLVALIVLATAGFVVGTSIERHDSRSERSSPSSGETSGESAETHAAETTGSGETHKELRPLGVNIEAVGFVVLASLASLGLAALGYTRPRWLLGLAAIAVAMIIFGALDVREAFHQSDESRTGLVVLAACIAALHFAAAALAGAMSAPLRASG
jgi:hypothetical protein